MAETPDSPPRVAQQYVRPASIPPSSLPSGQPELEDSRARAIRLLTDRYADDSLTEDEFEWRLAHLSAATSPEGLDAIVADLASPSAQFAAYPAVALTMDFARITSIMSQDHRLGQWAVPRSLRLFAMMAEVKLDFRHARIPAMCNIDLRAVMANVEIILPPDLAVDFEVDAFMSSARNEAFDGSYVAQGPARIRVRGSALMSEVKTTLRHR